MKVQSFTNVSAKDVYIRFGTVTGQSHEAHGVLNTHAERPESEALNGGCDADGVVIVVEAFHVIFSPDLICLGGSGRGENDR